MTTQEDDSSAEETSTEVTTAETETSAQAVAETLSTKPSETSTTEATTAANQKPGTKAEILAYYNAAVKKAKADKPGYSVSERTLIDDKKISSSKGWINSVAPGIVSMARGSFSKWSDPEVTAKGASHSDLPPFADIKAEWVKSASCTESGGNYQIKIVLIDERVPDLPENSRNTIHGQVLRNGVYTRPSIQDGADTIGGLEINKFACHYSGCYLDATVGKAAGAIAKITTLVSCQADVEAKLPVFGTLDASVPLANESLYTFN